MLVFVYRYGVQACCYPVLPIRSRLSKVIYHPYSVPSSSISSSMPSSSSCSRPATGQRRAEKLRGTKGSQHSRLGSTPFNDQPNDDTKVVDFLKLLDMNQPLKMFSRDDSSKGLSIALAEFHQLKGSHNALSDSMSQSLFLPKSGSTSTPGKQLSIKQPVPVSHHISHQYNLETPCRRTPSLRLGYHPTLEQGWEIQKKPSQRTDSKSYANKCNYQNVPRDEKGRF